MLFDFSELPLQGAAFSRQPMTLLDVDARNQLTSVMDICAVETGDHNAVVRWQKGQIDNLLAHARLRSPFWRERIGKRTSADRLPFLPVQTRADVVAQVASEGPLFSAVDQMHTELHLSSGSSGKPVRFYVSGANIAFNGLRYLAQYFLEKRKFNLNRTQLVYIPSNSDVGFSTIRDMSWLGPFSRFISSGVNKKIRYIKPNMEALRDELSKEPIGYLVASPWIVELMMQELEAEFFSANGAAMYIPIVASPDAELRKKFDSVNIPVRGTYSAEEVGLIASECSKCPGFFHVAKSNVVVEVEPFPGFGAGQSRTGKVLVTHLHSYATPFIRYDLGDIASLSPSCECGHNGPTLSNIIGRSKALLKHADGRYSVFHLRGGQMAEAIELDEYRIRQTTLTDIVVEIARERDLSAEECETVRSLVRKFSGDEFNIHILSVRNIDWGESKKRLGFRNELLARDL